MTRREEFIRKRLRSGIEVHAADDKEVVILCQERIANKIYKVLNGEGVSCSQPKRIVFTDEEGTIDSPDFEILVSLTEDEANRRVDDVVNTSKWDEKWPRH